MPRPTKLLPGQEVTVEAFNAEIDRTRKQLSSAVGSTIQTGATGGGITAMREIQPLWGRLTKKGLDRNPDYFQWEEVYWDKGTWVAKTGDADTTLAPHDSVVFTDVYGEEWLINPAVEVNGEEAKVGDVFRMVPTENFVEEGKGLFSDRDDFWMHRHWLFSNPQSGIRPFKLTADLIPTGGVEPDLTIAAEFLDNPGEEVTLYPVHRSGWPSGDEFISLGVGRGPGAYFRGTYGWTKFQPKATIIGIDSNGDPIWRPEWQIVTIYAETRAQVLISDAMIEAGAVGAAKLFLQDKHSSTPAMVDTGYSIQVFNTLFTPLTVGTTLEVNFSLPHYNWTPESIAPQHGHTIYGSGVGVNTTGDWVVVALDLNLANFGVALQHDGNTIKNISDGDVIGLVSWQFVAQRDLDPAPVIPGPDAVARCSIFNNGVQINPSEGSVTSSRRRLPTAPETAAEMGPKAINTAAGSVIVKIASGEAIDMRAKHVLNVDANDIFTVLPAWCHLTFTTIPGVLLNP